MQTISSSSSRVVRFAKALNQRVNSGSKWMVLLYFVEIASVIALYAYYVLTHAGGGR